MALLGRLRDEISRTTEQLGRRVNDLLGSGTKPAAGRARDTNTLEELESLLLQSDVGVTATSRIIERLRSGIGKIDLRNALKAEIRSILSGADVARDKKESPLQVILVVGVNGSGKTTTVAKLAHTLTQNGGRPIVCAADSFRAAAIEQLSVWASRAKVEVIKGNLGADPASIVFDAINVARARNRNILLVDTAGRLHTRVNLMAELEKIRHVVEREVEAGPHEVLLVIDATVGQNGLVQARHFLETAMVTGIVLSKLDGTAKGGIAIAVAEELKIPIRYVGVGEELNDLLVFSIDDYVNGLLVEPS